MFQVLDFLLGMIDGCVYMVVGGGVLVGFVA